MIDRARAKVAELAAQGVQFVAPGSLLAKAEREARETIQRSVISKNNVPQFFRDVEIETGRLSEYLLNRSRNGKSSFVCGRSRTFKTFSACAVLNYLTVHGKDCFFIDTNDLMIAGTHEGAERGITPKMLYTTRYLVVDDIDKLNIEGDFGKSCMALFNLVDKRQGLVTIWTSNQSYEEFGARISAIRTSSTMPIMGRLKEQCGSQIIAIGDGVWKS